MSDPIARYAENTAATFNAGLARLEALVLATGNVIDLVDSGTLTTTESEISMDLGSTEWAFLMLRASLITSAGNDILMYGNHDIGAGTRYCSDLLSAVASGSLSGSTTTSIAYAGRADTNAGFIEATIWPNSLGFAMSGCCNLLRADADGLQVLRFGSVYTGGTIATSLQLRPFTAGVMFAVGSTWRLEGVRA
jgi:hypothetical protein